MYRWIAILALALLSLGVAPHAVRAAGALYVSATTGSDTAPVNPNACSDSAHPCATIAHAVAEASDGQTIDIAAGPSGPDTYDEHGITLSESLTFAGTDATFSTPAGTGDVVVDGGGVGQPVFIAAGTPGFTVTFQNLTIENGGGSRGGGIDNQAATTLNVTDCVIQNNAVDSPSRDVLGGGIYDNAATTLDITDSTISGNSVSAGVPPAEATSGDGIAGHAAYGGGVFSLDAALTVTGSAFASNTATGQGGGTSDSTQGGSGNGGSGGAAQGGAIYLGAGASGSISDSTFTGNGATAGAGGAGDTSNTTGAGASGGSASGGGIESAGGTLSVTGSAFGSNTVTGANGGISGDGDGGAGGAALGGGIHLDTSTSDSIANSSFTGNTATAGAGGAGGVFSGSGGSGGAADGGGVDSSGGTLIVPASTFHSNSVTGGKAAGGLDGAGTAGVGQGGGIYLDTGTSGSISGSSFTNNDATAGAGSVSASTGSSGGSASGGGIATAGSSLIVSNSRFDSNTVTGAAGGPGGAGQGAPGGMAQGGGIFTAAPGSISSTSFTGNHANAGAGGSSGGSGTGGDGGTAMGGAVSAADVTSISDSTLNGNGAAGGASGQGGASGAPSGAGGDVHGGAVYVGSAGLTLLRSTVSGTVAIGGLGAAGIGGGLGEPGGSGGTVLGIALYFGGSSTVGESTVFGNNGTGGNGGKGGSGAGAGGSGGAGGKVIGGAYLTASGSLTMLNSTLSGNGASGGSGNDGGTTTGSGANGGDSGDGSGAALNVEGTATLTNDTIAGNRVSSGSAGAGGAFTFFGNDGSPGTVVPSQGAGINVDTGATLTMTNTILAGNVDTTNSPGVPSDCAAAGTVTSSGHNLIGAPDSCNTVPSDMTGSDASPLDPRLDALAGNGGPVETMALQPGSPALGLGDVAACQRNPGPVGLDARGYYRHVTMCDAGAFEAAASPSRAASGGGPTMYDIWGQGISPDTTVFDNYVPPSTALTLEVDGDGFAAGDAVWIGGVSLPTNFVNSQLLTVDISGSALANYGAYDVSVNQSSNHQTLFVSANPATILSQADAAGTNTASTGGTGADTAGSLSATGAGGSSDGSITVAQYERNPTGLSDGSVPGPFLDVHIHQGATPYTSVTVVDCNLDPANQVLYWFDDPDSSWVSLVSHAGPGAACETVIIPTDNAHPTLAELGGTVFGAGSGSPTASRLSLLSAARHGGVTAVHWRMADQHGVTGFALYTGSRRLGHGLIAVHRSPTYHVRVRAGGSRLSLHIFLQTGRQEVVRISNG
jgi:hypothetical protein